MFLFAIEEKVDFFNQTVRGKGHRGEKGNVRILTKKPKIISNYVKGWF